MTTKHRSFFEGVPDLVERVISENARLRTRNAELAAALETVAALSVDGMVTTGKPLIAAIERARTVLAKVQS